MRSCALRILLAATISMALVIFCVLEILEILVRISLPAAINYFLDVCSRESVCINTSALP